MSRRPEPAPDPGAVWRGLSKSEQVKLARSVARRRSREWRRKYPNVMAAGVGYRITGRDEPQLTSTVCLKFSVSRKWHPDETAGRQGGLPDQVKAYVMRRGKRVLCHIPTDVDEFSEGAPSAAQDLGSGVVARAAAGGPGSTGAAFALVRDAEARSNLYLLGCHHVLTRSLRRSVCAPDPTAELFRRDDGLVKIGELAFWADLSPARLFGLDFAAVFVTDPAKVSSFNHGVEATRIQRDFETPVDFRIHTPRGPVSARFVAELFDQPLKFKCGNGSRTIRFKSVYQSAATTIGGDSGSPLIGRDGTLFGMHFYSLRGFALALPAFELFQRRHFNMDMELVRGHNP